MNTQVGNAAAQTTATTASRGAELARIGPAGLPLSGCASCRMQGTCIPNALSEAEQAHLDTFITSRRRLKAGQTLYRSGDLFGAVYVLRAGFIKTLVLQEDGREQVIGFHMPGDMLGMDGLAFGTHPSDAIALEDCDVCVIAYESLTRHTREAEAIQHHLYQLFSREVLNKRSMMIMLGSMTSEQRVAGFLLNLSQRLAAQGFSPSDFMLRMSRDEIGSLLGMQLETVSRILSRFQKYNLIEVRGRHVRIMALDKLQAMVTH
jgi:CRP/FNR family transcriptional regulator